MLSALSDLTLTDYRDALAIAAAVAILVLCAGVVLAP